MGRTLGTPNKVTADITCKL